MQIKKLSAQLLWLLVTIILLSFIIFCYYYLHEKHQGEEVKFLSKGEITTVNSIYIQKNDTNLVRVKAEIKNYLTEILEYQGVYFKTDSSDNLDSITKVDIIQKDELTEAISGKYGNNIEKIMDNYSLDTFIQILPTYPFKIKSYFWLSGHLLYLELIFWTLFGVFASLFYNVSEAIKRDEFKIGEIPIHIAKIFYAPLITIAIYLMINNLTSSGDVFIPSAGKGIIVLSFILGFFSGRAIRLLNKIKELILPKGKEEEQTT